MLMIGFRGLEVNDDHFIVRDIRERNLGGVVLFDYDAPSGSPVRNIESPAQVQALVAALQAAALQAATDAEIVLHTEPQAPEIDFKVQSADAAAAHIEAAGGRVAVPPFDIQIGRCTVVQDPWGNEFVLLDASKGLLVTDEEGNVVGNAAPQASADDTTVR
jgi:predicted enzyme related to lactoylglutathione lyase